MRPLGILAALVLCVPGPALAQEWDTYVSRVDRFSITFPGEPAVEDIRWDSEYGAVLPGARLLGSAGAEPLHRHGH